MTRLLAIAASYRGDISLNQRLLNLAIARAKAAGAEVTTLDYAECEAPLYRGEAVSDHLPHGASLLADSLLHHDGFLLATPEYNWSIPGGLKNLIDWLSVDPRAPLNGKTALLMCATPSIRCGISGLLQLRTPLDALGCWVYPQMIGIGKAEEQLGADRLVRETDQQHLVFCVEDFVRTTGVLHAAKRS